MFATSFTCFVLGWHASNQAIQLPPLSDILDETYNEPRQELIAADSFDLNYHNVNYTVLPVADYELWGLVVTHNDILALDDIYHDESSIDIKDICVIWGNNLQSEEYLNWEFWSEPWTCFYQTKTRETLCQ